MRLLQNKLKRRTRDRSETIEEDIGEKVVFVDWESEFPLQYENNVSKNVLVHNLAGYIVKKIQPKN